MLSSRFKAQGYHCHGKTLEEQEGLKSISRAGKNVKIFDSTHGNFFNE